jgi:hypothetical protein
MPGSIPVKLFSELFTQLVPYIGFTVYLALANPVNAIIQASYTLARQETLLSS